MQKPFCIEVRFLIVCAVFAGRGVLGSACSRHTSWCRFCVEGEAGEAKYSNMWAVTFDIQGKTPLWLWTCLEVKEIVLFLKEHVILV